MPLLPWARPHRRAPLSRLGSGVAQGLARVRPEHLALGRAGAGVVMLTRPRALPATLGVDAGSTSWAVQMLGAREIALGLGTAAALRAPDRSAARLWLAAGVLSDAVDALAVGAATARGTVARGRGGAVGLVALAATVHGLRALRDPLLPP